MVATHSPHFFALLPVLSSVVHGHSVELGVGLSCKKTAMLCCKSFFCWEGYMLSKHQPWRWGSGAILPISHLVPMLCKV